MKAFYRKKGVSEKGIDPSQKKTRKTGGANVDTDMVPDRDKQADKDAYDDYLKSC